MASKNYSSEEVDLAELVTELREFFDAKNYSVQRRDGPAGGIILNANKSGNPRDWLGLSLGLTARINVGSEVTRVWIGNQKWVDKIFVGFIGLVLYVLLGDISIRWYSSPVALDSLSLLLKIFAVLLILLPALGAYLQYKVTQELWNAIEDHVALRSKTSP